MVKINEQVAQLINKLEQGKDEPISIAQESSIDFECCACSCSNNEHEEYVYCSIVDAYICDVCCKFELCNDYQLVNEILNQQVFKSNAEVLLLCQQYCSND
ncbi:MAG: hypothetical protein ACQERJ_08660 [Bacillota bacterium]